MAEGVNATAGVPWLSPRNTPESLLGGRVAYSTPAQWVSCTTPPIVHDTSMVA